MTYKEFANIIKNKRENLFITQKEFALKIPTKPLTYYRIENGIQEPTFYQLQQICILLDIDFTEIVLKK